VSAGAGLHFETSTLQRSDAMKKLIVLCCVACGIGALTWSFFQMAPKRAPIVSQAPVTQYQQDWRSWQEQVAQIKKQYGLDQVTTVSVTNEDEFVPVPASTASVIDSQTAIVQQSINAGRSAPSEPPAVSPRNKSFEKDESLFWRESVDDIWAQQSSQQVVDYFSQTQSGRDDMSVLNDVECRSSRCKGEVVHDNPQAAEEFELDFPATMAGHLNGITYRTDQRLDGRIAVVMYLSK